MMLIVYIPDTDWIISDSDSASSSGVSVIVSSSSSTSVNTMTKGVGVRRKRVTENCFFKIIRVLKKIRKNDNLCKNAGTPIPCCILSAVSARPRKTTAAIF